MVNTLQKSTLNNISSKIGTTVPEHHADVRAGNEPLTKPNPGLNHVECPKVSFANNVTGNQENADNDKGSNTSTHYFFDSQLESKLCTHVHGQMALSKTC